jgi:anti-sigma regulatory factor (Ser/Thr protein kinase)
MRTDRIPLDDRAGTGARSWRVDDSGPGAEKGPDASAPGGATHRALSVWPSAPPGTPSEEGGGFSSSLLPCGGGPGWGISGADSRGRAEAIPTLPPPRHFPGDEVEIEFGFSLPNHTVVIPAVLARLRERAAQFGLFDEITADRVSVALTEALVNGIMHGNLELESRLRREDEASYDRTAEFRRRRPPYRDRRLQVRARLSRREAVYVIRDEGPGFDPPTLPDPTDPAHLERTTGRGLLLIRAFMDEVAFNGAGNQITLLKRRTTSPNANDM